MQSRSLPQITEAPAPWLLHGRGYISLLRFPVSSRAQDAFVPDSLAGKRSRSRTAWMMFVDYQQSDVGPYHELLFIPGSFPFEDGRRHLSISRIFVSSIDSVVNGQRNWGIPKDVAQFDVRYGSDGIDAVTVRKDGALIAELRYRSWPLPLPFSTALVPRPWRTLGQHRDGSAFIYAPSANGWIRPASLLEARSNPELFPDLDGVTSPLSVAVPRFSMRFPVSMVLPLPG
jgi:hypothetical protein